jgi:putative CocE/NonD family hydrolase
MSFRVEKDIMVPMRDGVRLATDVWVLAEGGPAPVLLVRLPYGKDMIALHAYGLTPNVFALVEAGYAVVYQDCRGTFRSGGEFTPMVNEPSDGADTVAWLLEQPWCDGNIGTFGMSYLGFVQWASASASDHLKAIAPAVTTTDYYATPWYSEGGALSLHAIQTWTTLMALSGAQRAMAAGSGDPQALMGLVGMAADPGSHLAELPVRARPLLEKQWPWWADILAHPARDQFWRDLSVADHFEDITVPALNIGGWFDLFVNSTTRTFTELKRRGGSADARDGQRLIIGPWDHLNSTGVYPDRQFGLMADAQFADLTGAHQRFSTGGCAARPVPWTAPRRSGSSSWALTSGATSRTGRCPIPPTPTITCTAPAARTPPTATGNCAWTRQAANTPTHICTTRGAPFPPWAAG